MTTPVHADPRRSGPAVSLGITESEPGAPGLEMPVLFQLSDLTQHKVLTPPSPSKPALPADAPSPPAATEVKTSPSQHASIATPAAEPEPAGAEKPLLASAAAAAETSGPVAADSPTIREREKIRERRRQAATHGDWFQTQGKYILVVFLVLLVGVIYIARQGGDDSPPPPTLDTDIAAETPQSLSPIEESGDDARLADSSQPAPESGSLDTPDLTTPHSTEDTNPPDLAADAMVAHPGEESPAVDSAPQVTLQAPVQEEPIERPPADGGLFPWADQPEPRVATRPAESQGSPAYMPQANPHFQARPQAPGTAAAPSLPANAPPIVYPSTGIDEAPLPQSPPAAAETPAVYPVVDPPLGPAAPRSSSVQPPRRREASGVMPASYENRVSTDTRTSGPRHERTGSGLY